VQFKPLNAKLNPICHLLALLRAHPIFHVSRIRVNAVSLSKSAKSSDISPILRVGVSLAQVPNLVKLVSQFCRTVGGGGFVGMSKAPSPLLI
jgi:hypothetical protein